MRYIYLIDRQTRFLEDTGHYRVFGMRCYQEDRNGRSCIARIDDLSADKDSVQRLADLCTQLQVRPVHLQDVAEAWVAGGDTAVE